MSGFSFHKRSEMPVSARARLDCHERPGAFRRLAPSWTRVRPVQMPIGLNDGDRAEFQVRIGPIWKTWIAEHRDVVPGERFRDPDLQPALERLLGRCFEDAR